MTVGVHCAHFEMRHLVNAMVGVVGPGFDPAASGWARDSAEGWMMDTGAGGLWHGDDSIDGMDVDDSSDWAGQPKEEEIKDGDVVVRRPPCETAAPWMC